MNFQCAYCGSPSRKNDICGHGVADGVCCICEDCHLEDESDDEEETLHVGIEPTTFPLTAEHSNH